MILVDSCGWLEVFTESSLSDKFLSYFVHLEKIVTPAIVLYEVYKRVKSVYGDDEARFIAAQIYQTRVVPLSASIALYAADLSLAHKLPMADAIIYATAMIEKCEVVTSDAHFKNLTHVLFVE